MVEIEVRCAHSGCDARATAILNEVDEGLPPYDLVLDDGWSMDRDPLEVNFQFHCARHKER